MTIDKSTLPPQHSPKSVTSLIGAKTISTTVPSLAYRHGSVTVIELAFSDSTTNYLKVGPNGTLEIGGTAEMGTGTRISW